MPAVPVEVSPLGTPGADRVDVLGLAGAGCAVAGCSGASAGRGGGGEGGEAAAKGGGSACGDGCLMVTTSALYMDRKRGVDLSRAHHSVRVER